MKAVAVSPVGDTLSAIHGCHVSSAAQAVGKYTLFLFLIGLHFLSFKHPTTEILVAYEMGQLNGL